jgi:pSer/pThr/pTyr-binding forkhead associated (FHA) protein
MESHHETETLPEMQRVAMAASADAITALRIVGREIEYPLLAGKATFSLGSSTSCDVCIDNKHVSGLHGSLHRKGQRIRVVDQDSHNGTHFSGRREQSFDIGPGDTFTAASTTLLALNEEMRMARPIMIELLGTHRGTAVDELLSSSVRGHNLILFGEEGCEQGRLARALHRASPRGLWPMLELSEVPQERAAQRAILDGAQNGAILLTLKGRVPPPDEAFRSMLLSSDFRIRLYLAVPSREVATEVVGFETATRMISVHLLPLRERSGELPWLLDRIFNERQAKLRTADLRPINQRALQHHGWSQNFLELRDAAHKLIALATHETVTKAAEALEMPRTTLLYWVEEKMQLPLLGAR